MMSWTTTVRNLLRDLRFSEKACLTSADLENLHVTLLQQDDDNELCGLHNLEAIRQVLKEEVNDAIVLDMELIRRHMRVASVEDHSLRATATLNYVRHMMEKHVPMELYKVPYV